MCGQFGILTTSSNINADDFLSDAFVTSMLRGVDSSGIANIDLKRNTYLVHKLPVSGLFFKDENVAKRVIKYSTSAKQLSMCHVRAATVGNITVSNAHPFAVEKQDFTLVGTHNGTLTGWSTKKDGKYFDVDSEWALNRIAEEGIDAFKEFNGAYSFVWWRGDEPETLFMARNSERPMAVVFLKDGGMAYASEAGMLYWLLERNSIPMESKVLILDKGKLYKFPVDNPSEFTTEDLPAPSYYSYGTGYASSNRSYYYKTTVENVKELIAQAKASPSQEPGEDGKEYSFPQAYQSEITLARDYGWFDMDAEFILDKVDGAGHSHGYCEVAGHDFDAFIRGDFGGVHPLDHIWKCKVLGVQEEGNKMVLVLSSPSKTYPFVELPNIH